MGTAIVHRACVDYLAALRGHSVYYHSSIGTPEEIESFFKSAWFGFLCDADGEALIYELRRLYKAGRKSIHYAENSREEK